MRFYQTLAIRWRMSFLSLALGLFSLLISLMMEIEIWQSMLQQKLMQNQERSREKMRPENSRQCWELEVRNLPEHGNKEDLLHFLWKSMEQCRGLLKPTNPIIQSAMITEGQRKLVIQFRSFEEALNCLQLDHIYYGKKVLSITSRFLKKPAQPTINTDRAKLVQSKSYDEFRKIYVANLPCMPEHQIMNMLSEFGELKSFLDLTKDSSGSQCYCEYVSDDATQQALRLIGSTRLKGRQLIAKRAALMGSIDSAPKTKVTQVKPVGSRFQKDLNDFYATFDTVGFFKNKNITCVILLRGIVPSGANLKATLEDIKKQVQKIGPISKISHYGANIYIEYERLEYAQIAYLLLISRKYDGKNIDVSFYDPVKFADDILL